jgi:hypothetical protein
MRLNPLSVILAAVLAFFGYPSGVGFHRNSFVIRDAMTIQRPKPGNRLALGSGKQPAAVRYSVGRFPIQHEIQNLESDLDAFNERILELEDEGHRGHAMEVLKANAMDLARRIDELRCLLVEPNKKGERPG